MLFCFAAILNGKLRAAVEATQTGCAFILDPYRLIVFHAYRLHGASFCAQTAAYTAVFNAEMPCLPHTVIIFIRKKGDGIGT